MLLAYFKTLDLDRMDSKQQWAFLRIGSLGAEQLFLWDTCSQSATVLTPVEDLLCTAITAPNSVWGGEGWVKTKSKSVVSPSLGTEGTGSILVEWFVFSDILAVIWCLKWLLT